MEIRTIFVKDKLLNDLSTNIHDAAAFFTNLLEIIKKQFPNIERNTDLLWILLQKEGVREYLCFEMSKSAAIRNGFACEYEKKPEDLLQSTLLERKFNEATIRQDLSPFRKITELTKRDYHTGELRHLFTYLRTGAIFVDSDGWVTIAKDADARLKAYCSVTTENKKEATFVSTLVAMRNDVAQIKKRRADLANLVINEVNKDAILNSGHMEDRLLIAPNMRLMGDNAVWRSLVTFITTHRAQDTARFFNSVGTPKYDVIEVYNRTGYLPAPTPGLRLKYPALYANVSYLRNKSSIPFDVDDAEMVEALREYIEQMKARGFKNVHLNDDGVVCWDSDIDKIFGLS